MRLQKKSYSRVSLTDLLRRKRSNLKKFLTETGIVTYELLLMRCESMGVVPPSASEFLAAKGNPVLHEISSPTEGVVVIQAPPEETSVETTENSEESVLTEHVPNTDNSTDPIVTTDAFSKKKKKKS